MVLRQWWMSRTALEIKISKKHQEEMNRLVKRRDEQPRVVLRCLVLLQLAKGVSAPKIARTIPLTPQAIRRIGHRYQDEGLKGALYDKPRPGAVALLDDSQKQWIIAIACSNPPQGRARWTIQLLAQEAVKRSIVPSVGRETIRILLLAHDLKPWREKNVVRPRTQQGIHRQNGNRVGSLRTSL